MALTEELISRFGKSIDKPELIQSCQEIIKIFSISIEDLYINWESFVVTKYDGIKLDYSPDNFLKLQNYIQSNLEKKKNQNGNVPSTVKANRKINLSSSNSSPFNFLPTTPSTINKKKKIDATTTTPSVRKLVSPSTVSNPQSTPYQPLSDLSTNTPTPLKNDQESGKIIESLNSSIPISEGFTPDIDSENPIKLIANFDPKKYQFRTMRTKLLETADVLDDQIDSFIKIIQSHYNFSQEDFANPSIISQSETVAVGRIVPDNPLTPTDLVLNSDSLALETSRMVGIGRRVQLDLSNLANYSFFPGQIVALKGKNASGEYFKVTEVIDIPLLGAPVSSRSELEEFNNKLDQDVKVVITTGPYTSSNDLKFDRLSELVNKLNNEIKPHVVIMFGPFIDITHPSVINGQLDLQDENTSNKKPNTLDDIFKLIVSPILKRINNKIQIILIPSLKDAISKHAAYPQDSLDRKALQLTKNFKSFPNPSIFQINEILLGVSNNDVFKDLKDVNKGEFLKTNRFDRIANHIIQQRRFYPVFPGSSSMKKRKIGENDEVVENSPAAELDVPYLGLSEFGDVIPDILIVPSELRFFARVVKNVLIINPGTFMRPNSVGTFAQLTIKKADLANDLSKIEGDEELFLHDIWKRARVDIIKV